MPKRREEKQKLGPFAQAKLDEEYLRSKADSASDEIVTMGYTIAAEIAALRAAFYWDRL